MTYFQKAYFISFHNNNNLVLQIAFTVMKILNLIKFKQFTNKIITITIEALVRERTITCWQN
jgi:hypothetical protein